MVRYALKTLQQMLNGLLKNRLTCYFSNNCMYLKHAPLFRIPVKPRPIPEKDPLETLAKTARKDP